jgi:hypothetical protein
MKDKSEDQQQVPASSSDSQKVEEVKNGTKHS